MPHRLPPVRPWERLPRATRRQWRFSSEAAAAAAGRRPLPAEADVVIIGGGILGACAAHYLTQRGRGVLVLEQNTIASGTTWHAAGLCAGFKGDEASCEVARVSQELYSSFVDERGESTVGWHQTGSLAVAASRDRWRAIQRVLPSVQRAGLEYEVLSTPEAVCAAHPLLSRDRVVGGVLLPRDGLVAPYDVCMHLSKLAKRQGAQIAEHTRVTGFEVESCPGRGQMKQVTAVHTVRGTVRCKQLALCPGMWARWVGKMLGVPIPISSAPHQYMVTELMPGVSYDLPVVRDYDARIYVKPEVGGLVVGEFEGEENRPGAWDKHRDDGYVPHDLPFELLDDDENKSIEGLTLAMDLVPALQETGIKRYVHGPDSSSADHAFILGPLPMFANTVIAAGMNSMGIGSGAGVGLAVSEWLCDGYPKSFKGDFSPHHVRRFHPVLMHDDLWSRERGLEGYSKLYTIHWPFEEFTTERGKRATPLYEKFSQRGAVMGQAGGMERVNWFAEPGGPTDDLYSFDYPNTSWHKPAELDSKAAREDCVMFDMSSFAKVRVSGPNAAAELERLCTLKIDRPPEEANRLVYTAMCNARGGIEADLTVLRESAESFYLVVGATMGPHLAAHISENLSEGSGCIAEDVSDETGVLSVMGPRSREVLTSAIPGISFATADFPFGTHQQHEVGGISVRLLRVSFIGELGWEIHCRMADLAQLHEIVRAGGERIGVVPRDGGYRAINALRVERMFVHWGADVSPLDTPVEVGWPIKKSDFLGRDALVKMRKEGLRRRFVSIIAQDPDVSLFGHNAEALYRKEPGWPEPRFVGTTTSGAWSYTLGRSVALGYVERGRIDSEAATWEWVLQEDAEYTLVVDGRHVPVELRKEAAFDPKGERMRA
eukprot:TRINITY_DN16773_c0_g1_i1.p1 TRINITY_DN16773_c0_g1~~TRINITY_DN16773_c0_g1_i1.p1  ORF type:complete len:885 (+),score=248.32 TRINITY_DN16773_c0_g1_i1:105-2759(+)